MSRAIEHRLDRFFTVDAADVTRVYVVGGEAFKDPDDASVLLLPDDLSADPTSIKVDEDRDGSFADETAWAATDYELLPLNAALGPEPRPYTAIRATSWGTKSWTNGDRVELVAKFGWLAIPEGVKRATIDLTAILRIESPRATRQINLSLDRIETMTPEARGIVRELVAGYGRGPVVA